MEGGRWNLVNALILIDCCFSFIDYCFPIVSLWVREQKLTEQLQWFLVQRSLIHDDTPLCESASLDYNKCL